MWQCWINPQLDLKIYFIENTYLREHDLLCMFNNPNFSSIGKYVITLFFILANFHIYKIEILKKFPIYIMFNQRELGISSNISYTVQPYIRFWPSLVFKGICPISLQRYFPFLRIMFWFFNFIDNQEKTPKCWYVMPVIRATTPSVSSQPWILYPRTHGNAE